MALTSNFPAYPEMTCKKKTAVHCADETPSSMGGKCIFGPAQEAFSSDFRKNPELAAGRNQRRKEFIVTKRKAISEGQGTWPDS